MQDSVELTREFDAPRELVFKAWTEPERLMKWWGPKGFTSPICRIDLRPGGTYLSCMRSPDGRDFWSKGVFREIQAPERLVMTDSFADVKGNTVPATYYGMGEGWPLEMLITVTFDVVGRGTRVTISHSGLGTVPDTDRDNMRQGWNESLDKLATYIAEARRREY